MAKVAVIGMGTIGKHLIETLPRYGYDPVLTVNSREIRDVRGERVVGFSAGASPSEKANIVQLAARQLEIKAVLLAIPSGNKDVEIEYLEQLCSRRIICVTAGKSALANHYGRLQGAILHSLIGCDAALGGGTMIPSALYKYLHQREGHPFIVTAVLNGTLNYIQTRVEQDAVAEQIVNSALREGFAEPMPGGRIPTILEMYLGEFDDVLRKTAFMINCSMLKLLERPVTTSDLAMTTFGADHVGDVLTPCTEQRYIVQVTNHPFAWDPLKHLATDGAVMNQSIGPLSVRGGFVRLGAGLRRWVPDDVGNAIHIVQNGDRNVIIGNGAGPVATCGAMITNLRELIPA